MSAWNEALFSVVSSGYKNGSRLAVFKTVIVARESTDVAENDPRDAREQPGNAANRGLDPNRSSSKLSSVVPRCRLLPQATATSPPLRCGDTKNRLYGPVLVLFQDKKLPQVSCKYLLRNDL